MKIYQLIAASALLMGCASSNMSFHPIEPRSTANIVKVKVRSHDTLGVVSDGKDATYHGGINLDVFRAKVMTQTGIRFVVRGEDASIQISFGPNTFHSFLGMFDKHWEQYYTMRITENSGRIIYVTEGILVGQDEGQQALELNRLFVDQVIPALQGKKVALEMNRRVATL